MNAVLQGWIKLLLCALLPMLLSGCFLSQITLSFMGSQWNPAELSKESCPNLDGIYHAQASNEEGSHLAELLTKHYYKFVILDQEIYKYSKGNPKYFFNIKRTGEEIQVQKMYDPDHPFATFIIKLKFDGKLRGCYNNALLIRENQSGGNEWGYHSYSEYEYEIRKLSDGSIQLETRRDYWGGTCHCRTREKHQEADI